MSIAIGRGSPALPSAPGQRDPLMERPLKPTGNRFVTDVPAAAISTPIGLRATIATMPYGFRYLLGSLPRLNRPFTG